MANVTFKNESTSTSGELPAVGDQLPDFTLVGTDLSEITPADLAGNRVVLNIFPSLDTGVCAASVREFNKRATSLDNTVVLGVSQDLPFAHGRFCSAEGIDNVTTGSTFRSSFGEDYGLTLQGSPLQGLLARAVVVADENGKVVHTQLVDEITDEPDYDAAVNALS
ncbi:thiol peroxidase (atypical 2-Cys peroxiredoxin) [Corynebacterium pollutisoli]|uniref:Thiol peroxidase n=1 Tax=Corynebacterium pollutisoli TaxID=1610489 RepID=A0A1X7K7S7_9CORY|nr:thiol peroxidase [Corynebacterium pollutisoli]SMG36751.1 thiol peroxidase (atypical 2-Cys peroxiredoxin) [Corynebacterium pollutisoli]